MSNQKYTIEFKKQVVEFYLDHHTVKETLQQFHIHEKYAVRLETSVPDPHV
jgi:transposase-like protein